MHTEIQVLPKKSAKKNARTWIYVGRQTELTDESVLAGLPDSLADQWPKMVESCKPSDAGAVTQSWTNLDYPQKVVVVVLPEDCSRHNSPAQPHVITNLVRAQLAPSGKTAVLVANEAAEHATAIANAIARATPSYWKKSTKPDEPRQVALSFLRDDDRTIDNARLEILIDSTRFAAKLVDTPASELNTTTFVEFARNIAVQIDAEITVLEGESLAHAGLGGFWGVGKAATHGPALVILDYNPGLADQKTHAWVGKGIVYDTGGLSIKGKTGMPGMKTDMGGAAAVLSAFRAAVQLKARHRILALLCLAENSVGPDSTRPDDILSMYSGKTVEVNNTDAEGRLVLADGVAYVTTHYKPDVVIDLATLTGAQMVATGHRHAAIVCNDERIERATLKAGRATGDLVHPLPYCPEFFRKEFNSVVADMKNSVKDRMNGQSSCAAQFVAEHLVNYDGPWLHVDLAGPSREGERATGFGTFLLVELLDSLSL